MGPCRSEGTSFACSWLHYSLIDKHSHVCRPFVSIKHLYFFFDMRSIPVKSASPQQKCKSLWTALNTLPVWIILRGSFLSFIMLGPYLFFYGGFNPTKAAPPPNSIQILANLVFQKRGNLLVLHRSQRITHLSLQQMSLVMVLEKNVVLPGAEIREKTFAFLKASAQAMKIIEAKNYAFKKTTLTSTKRCFFQWMKHSWKIWLLTGDQSKPKGKAVWKNRTRFN